MRITGSLKIKFDSSKDQLPVCSAGTEQNNSNPKKDIFNRDISFFYL